MVIKKPYAFLIKHFRLIHGLLFGMLLFLMLQSVGIYTFFNGYAKTHTFLAQDNLASLYITPLMYIIVLLAILVLFVIYFILSIKGKGNRIYLAAILYYGILFVYFMYFHSVLDGLTEKVLDLETIRLLRDISLIVLIPQIVFLFIFIGRTLGFNLKQFEFKKDLEEMQIDTSDSEEVEVTLGNDTYKVARAFRKFLRLSKYFVLENKLFVIAVSSIFILGLSLFVYSKISVYQDVHEQEEDIQVKSLTYSVDKTYITNANMNNEIISDNKSYVLVNLSIINKSGESYKIDRDTFRLSVNNQLLLPNFGVSKYFSDLGEVFEPFEIKEGESLKRIVIFEIDDEFIKKEYVFKIKDLTTDRSGNNIYYQDIKATAEDLNETKDKGTYKLPNTIDFSDSLLKNTKLSIESYAVADRFRETYNFEIDGKVEKGQYIVQPRETNREALGLLKIKSRLTLDENIYLNKIIRDPADLLALYGLITYRYQGEYKTSKLVKRDVDYDSQTYSFMEVPKEVIDANKIDLVILVRGVKYTINLK